MQKVCKQANNESVMKSVREKDEEQDENPIAARETILNVTNKKYQPDTGEREAEHYNPSIRLVKIEKRSNETSGFGFHLTRSKWDPYPWVSAVDAATPAELSGLKAGDCILEVNSEDVLGLRIQNIAKLIKAKSIEHVTLLLWRTGMDANCDPESLCCGPMPLSLQRLSVIMQNILSIIECPVCLDTIPPPAMQCQNGHLLCVNCRIRAEKCPVCRDRYTPRRALIAEQIYNAITNAFNLCQNEDKLRQKLFGSNASQEKGVLTSQKNPSIELKPSQRDVHSMASPSIVPRNKFLAKLLGKACSVDNLASSSSSGVNGLVAGTSTPALLVATTEATNLLSTTNQLSAMSSNGNHKVVATNTEPLWSTGSSNPLLSAKASSCINSTEALLPSTSSTSSATSKVSKNNIFQANSTLKHFSLSTNDLSLDDVPIAIERCPSMQRLNKSEFCTTSATHIDVAFDDNDRDDSDDVGGVNRKLQKSLSSLLVGGRRPCSSLNSSVECIERSLRAVETTNGLKMISTSSPSAVKSYLTPLPSPSKCTATSLQMEPTAYHAIKNDLYTPSATTTSASSSSSTKQSLSVSPALLTTVGSLKLEANVPVVTPPHLTVGNNLQNGQLLKPVKSSVELHSKKKSKKNRLLCPFDCGKSFPASGKLQRHIRVVHHTPILSFGGSSAQLALPLQPPLDDAVLLLEIENGEAFNGYIEQHHDEHGDAEDNHHVRTDDKRCAKECWIRLKSSRAPDSNGCRIYASALLQGSIDECNDFLLETEVNRKQLKRGKEKNHAIAGKSEKNNSKNYAIDEDKELRPQQQQQPPLLTRSIVHSMESSTWHELLNTINSIGNNNSINNNSNALDYHESSDKEINKPRYKNNEPEHWLDGNGSLKSSMRSSNDLTQQSFISVIFQNDQHAMLHDIDSDVPQMVLNINVQRRRYTQ